MNSLKASKISKKFGAIEVLNSISLSFEAGSVTAIVGDNGAGKSTFLKILAGVHCADRGQIELSGKQLQAGSSDAHRRAGIEMVYQDFALAKNHDIVTNMFMGREIERQGFLKREQMRATAQKILTQLEINLPDLRQKVGVLSGGQQQAVAIARAILFDPRVLLLDEPTAALAAREVQRVISLIKQQRDLGRVIILVSHRLNDVFAVSDRIVVLKRGTVFSDNPCSELSMSEVVQRIVS